MKRIIYLILFVVSLYLAVFSSYGLLRTRERTLALDSSLRQYVTAKSQLDGAKMSVLDAQNSFTEKRTFEIAYGDIDKLVKVLNNVMTVTVSAVNTADLTQYFLPGSAWEAGMDAQAVIVSLTVDDTAAAMRVIGKMELPIYSITVTEPNIVNVTFLTGGEVQ